MIQLVVWYATLLFIILLSVVFVWVAFSSKKKQDYAPIIKRWYKARSIYGVLLVVFNASCYDLYIARITI